MKIFLRIYQIIISPIMHSFIGPGMGCRFIPSCSQYMKESIESYGIMDGFVLGIKRVMRCHPWAKGGYDPVRKKTKKL